MIASENLVRIDRPVDPRIDYRFELDWEGFMDRVIPWLPKFFINQALAKNLGRLKQALESK